MICDKYECSKVIGEGAYSQVRLATDTTTNKQVALKIMKLNCEESETCLNEAKMLEGISHKHIVNMIEYAEEAKLKKENGVKKVSYVAYELAEKGSLFEYIANTGALTEGAARYLFSQIVDGVQYLHSNGIVHRDIKSDNIVLDSEFNAKVCDLGFATKKSKCNTFKGTEEYMAPEIILKNGYNGKSADVFALGVLLFSMVTGKLPFLRAEQNDPRYKLI